MKAVILDCETTGRVAPVVPIEIAWCEIEAIHPVLMTSQILSRRFNPGRPIELGAWATHGIEDDDVAWSPPASSFRLPEGTTHLVGHQCDYDWEAIGRPPVKRIDTLALSRLFWPGLDSHALFAVLYSIAPALAREWRKDAHGAATDVLACKRLLSAMLTAQPLRTIDDLFDLSERARVPNVMPFGKWRGSPIAHVPADYKRWLLDQDNVDPYLRKALEAR